MTGEQINMNVTVSVICVYNDKKLLENNLAFSLEEQKGVEYEFVPVDNMTGRFENMSKAYNFGFNLSKGNILIFSHQDVVFGDDYFLHNICSWFKYSGLENFGLAGLIGVDKDGKVRGLAKVNDTINGIPVDRPTEVVSVDDFLIITTRECFLKAGKFDENLPGWHGYSMDLSILLRSIGLLTFVIPFFAIHNSNNRAIEVSDLQKSLKYIVSKNKNSPLFHPAYNIKEKGRIVMPGKIYKSKISSILKSIFGGTKTHALILIKANDKSNLHYPEVLTGDFSKYFGNKLELHQTYLIIDETSENHIPEISSDPKYSVVILYNLHDEKTIIKKGSSLIRLAVNLGVLDLFLLLLRKISGTNYSRLSSIVLISQMFSSKFR